MLPVEMEAAMDVRTTTRLDAALDACDIAMALRIQMERQDEGLFPSTREYHRQYGITPEHLRRHPDLLIMHPGPVNRGIELADAVVDHERSIILSQVTNGVALRMAVLYLLAPRREA
jgi:aspartate carbamoyltransferase catalytic subunit